ncbi:hypothetical protein KJA13_00505 [Patescibacteria group bacterium]|nr:hypothetical protein [Patescibacteria group bacterium]
MIDAKNLERRKKMETIVWIFYNVVPWLWLVTTIIFLIIAIIQARTRDSDDPYYGAWDFVVMETGVASVIVNIVGVLIATLVVFLIGKTSKIKVKK